MEMSMGADVDMGLQFPSASVDVIGEESGIPTGDDFVKMLMEAIQSSPKEVSRISCVTVPPVRALILVGPVGRFGWGSVV